MINAASVKVTEKSYGTVLTIGVLITVPEDPSTHHNHCTSRLSKSELDPKLRNIRNQKTKLYST